MWFHCCRRGWTICPKPLSNWKWRRFRPAYVFNPSHQGAGIQKTGRWLGSICVARYSLIALTPTWDAESDFAGVMNLQSWKRERERDEGKAIRVHHPQLQHGCIILYSSVTKGDSTLIRWSLYCMMICVNTLCRGNHRRGNSGKTVTSVQLHLQKALKIPAFLKRNTEPHAATLI